jgi:hypothetical protein
VPINPAHVNQHDRLTAALGEALATGERLRVKQAGSE